MLKRGFLKPQLSIVKLGKTQFWTGIIIGVCFSFILSYLFNYSREALRLITFMRDPFILTDKEFRLYDMFFATFSTSLGFGFTIIYWLRGRNQNIKKNYLKTFTISNAWLITFVALMLVARFGSILPIIVYSLCGYDNHLNVLGDFWLLLVLIPIYVFFAHWNTIRLIFRTKYWILISILFCSLTAFCLFNTTYADREIFNQAYYSQNKERFEYIDKEFQKANKMGIFFSDTTKNILQKRYAERTTDLVLSLKKTFGQKGLVPLDSLILEKIIIHNLHYQGIWFSRRDGRDNNWSFALPENIYTQITKYQDIEGDEVQLLFEILNEQISLFTATEIDWRNRENYSYYEKEKANYKRNLFYNTETIQSRLIQIVDNLKSDMRYEKYHYLLTEIKFDDNRGRQKYYNLK